MLWKIEDRPVFLLGSIHACSAADPYLSLLLRDIPQAVERLCFEADIETPPDMSDAFYDSAMTLRGTIGNELWRLVTELGQSLAISEEELGASKPWFAAIRLQFALLARHGFQFAEGVDKLFWARARELGREIMVLEEQSKALHCFRGSPIDEQIHSLGRVAREPQRTVDEFLAIFDAWRFGSEDFFEDLFARRLVESPSTFRCLITARNLEWKCSIEGLLQETPATLIVVGALHLVGDGGLIKELRRSGWNIQRFQWLGPKAELS